MALETHASFRHEKWVSALESAKLLQQKIDIFLTSPSEKTLKEARNAWKSARDNYSLTEVFRFQEGPIDHQKNGVEGYLNAWPLDESFIDYTVDDKYSGIINKSEKFPKLTKEILLELNEKEGEE